MTIRSEPLIPRWGVMILSVAVVAGMLYAVQRNNWIALVVLSLVLLFMLGADVTAIIRAWRGIAEPSEPDKPDVKP